MNVVAETSRLLLRTFTINNVRLVYDMNKDAEVTCYTQYPDPIISIEQAATILQETILPQYVLYNHGRRAAHIMHDLEFIGWAV